MTKSRTYTWISAVLVTIFSTTLYAQVNIEEWSHAAAIKMSPAPDQGLVQVPLGPEVFDLARPDLGDLRVVSETGREVPYVLRFFEEGDQVQSLSLLLYDRQCVDGRKTSVVADFGQKVLKNRIEIVTAGLNFRRRVLVECSSDGKKWEKVRDDAFIFRINEEAGVTYDKNGVTFADNNERYLRVTVVNDTHDRGRLDIDDVRAWQVVTTPVKTISVPIVETNVRDVPEEKSTEIAVDLGARSLPLHDLSLRFEDRNFFRRVSISGRNQKERMIKTPSQNGSTHEEVREEPWDVVTTGSIYRYSGKNGGDEALAVNLKGCSYRYLNIRVENADNPSLKFVKAEVNRLAAFLEFQPKDGKEFRLLVGNAFASSPTYALAQDIDRLRAQNIHPAALGDVEANSTYHEPGTAPISHPERHGLSFWATLITGVVVLVVLIRRQIKKQAAE